MQCGTRVAKWSIASRPQAQLSLCAYLAERHAALLVAVKSAAGLASERALRDELMQPRWCRHANSLADRDRDVDPDEIENRERTERVPGAKLQACIDGGWIKTRFHSQVNGAEQKRKQQAVDNESRDVWNLDCRLPQCLA